MNLTVFAGPDPDANLRELLNRTPLRVGPVCAVVPDGRSAAGLERALAAILGRAYTGHRVLTMEGLARAILAISGPIPDEAEPHIRRALAGEILARRLGEGSVWTGLAGYSGFAELFLSFLADIRSAAIPSGRAVSRDRGLASAAAAYDTHLRRLGVSDHEGWVALALEGDLIEQFCRTLRGAFVVHGFYDLTGRQELLLERVFGCGGRCAATLVHDPGRPELFALPGRILERFQALGARIVEASPSSSYPSCTGTRGDPSTGPQAVYCGFRSGSRGEGPAPGSVQIHTFRSAGAEADWVAGTVRSLLSDGSCEPEEIMIVSRFRPAFGSPLQTALARNRVPVEGGTARPLAHHPVARFVLTAIDASLKPDDEGLAGAVRESCFAGGFSRSGAFDGRSWNCMVEVGSPEDFVLSVRKMLDLLHVREQLDGGGDPARAASERAAWDRMQGLLDDFARFYTPLKRMMHADEFSRLFRLFLDDEALPERAAPGRGVLLADVNHARTAHRGVVFFTGLGSGSFPGSHGGFSLHEPELGRERRERMKLEDPLLFVMAFQGARRLFLTFPGIDDEGGDSTISPYLREIRDRFAGRIESVFHRAVPGAAREDGFGDSRGRGELLVRMLRNNAGEAGTALARIRSANPGIAGEIERAVRRCVSAAEEKGYFLETGEELDALREKWGRGRVFGVTDLETYASCPVKFLFARILRLEVEREYPGELNPRDRGLIVHEILARFYRGLIERGEDSFGPADRERISGEMEGVCSRVFAAHTEAFSELHPAVSSAERRAIRAMMEGFLVSEAEYFGEEPFRPLLLEAAFGRQSGESAEFSPPLRIGEGDGETLVGGRIDRIDIAPGGGSPRFRIIDYKTGGQSAAVKDLYSGAALQIPLYLKAAAESILPGYEVHDGVFYLMREMERKGYCEHRKPVAGEDWTPFLNIACESATSASAGIRAGRFPAGNCGKNVRCEFLPLCRGGRDISGEEDGDADPRA
jgi:RecB family exonuclease